MTRSPNAPATNGAPRATRPRGSQRSAVDEAFRELAEILREDSPLPLYRRLADHVTDWIEAGRFRPGSQLLSERTMSETLGISRRTVRAALGDLIARRYVSATHGCGNFVLEPPKLRETRILALERFRKEPVFMTPRHHDLIHEAETKLRVLVHYRYVPTTENLRDILLSPPSGYHGILLHRPSQDWIDVLVKNETALRPELPLPLMVSGRSLSGTGYHYVSPDHFDQTRAAAAKLIAKGHTRIGYVSGLISQDYMRLAYKGYERALQDATLPLHPEDHLVLESIESPDTEKAIRNFLAERQFSALVVAGSAYSEPFENAVQRAAIHVPGELSAILVTEKIILDRLALRWTAHLYPDEAVIRAVEALSELSGNSQAGAVQELVPFVEVTGATCHVPPVQAVAV